LIIAYTGVRFNIINIYIEVAAPLFPCHCEERNDVAISISDNVAETALMKDFEVAKCNRPAFVKWDERKILFFS